MSVNKDETYLDYSETFNESYLYEYGTNSPVIKVLDFSDKVMSDSEEKPVININYLVLTDNTIVTEQKPVSVYFRKGWREYFQNYGEQKMLDTLASNPELPWETKMCDDWNELSEVLKLKPHQIIFHVSMLEASGTTVYEFISMIKTLKKVIVGYSIPLAISIEKDTPTSLIKEFQKAEIYGIVPSVYSFGIDETYKGVDALFNRIPYWPKHILQQLPGAIKSVTKNTITLTARQSEIAELISSRGLSNKRIANALNITESTVKIHVSAILKAYGVRTRTQLAVVANK